MVFSTPLAFFLEGKGPRSLHFGLRFTTEGGQVPGSIGEKLDASLTAAQATLMARIEQEARPLSGL